eukprot:CAMPEP_0113452274 /NCGR_PEP_ID=MMETSP0014_2-20120614/6763_1 /TAXON_ID=2857 /ORGANISM="Nitzschia sp." /LENGTH=520 /DNA_ID=CAMNT_0000343643 /DNA_START=43 /DNA_END=1605 /DNA_ORIENTATION=- /assembly_acc=CAM_ASM_000159
MTMMKCRRQPRGSGGGASNVGASSSVVCCSTFIVGSLLLVLIVQNHYVDQSFVHAFTSTPYRSASTSSFGAVGRGWVSTPTTSTTSTSTQIAAAKDDDGDDEDSPPENPYADPNYPDLEFVNYDDPEYQVDQGVGDEFFDPESTEEQVEMMREERRVRNDEFQFETYYRDILKNGEEFKGEWMVYHTSTFTSDGDDAVDANSRPKLAKAAGPLKVISRGERIEIDSTADGSDSINDDEGTETTNDTKRRLVKQRIIHHEKIFSDPDDAENKKKTVELLKQEQISMDNKFWPEQLAYSDFRGHHGIMCVGSSYTICTAKQLNEDADDDTRPSHVGPFEEYRVELGLLDDVLRFRIKVDYSILDKDAVTASSSPPPALHLKSLTVCRETLGMWPRAEKYKSAIEAVTSDALWGPRGAAGGLYDPPPVGSAEQASQYLLLDLEGRATVLLPYLMDQDPDVHGPDSSGWVTSLDWTPGKNRFQADRKTNSGKDLMGLRTLELTEVESSTAEMWRPRDGGENMRQ